MVQKTIRVYLFLTGIAGFGLSLTFATYMLFLIGHGLTIFEASLVNVVFFVVVTLLEVPTGLVADHYGRKVSYVLSSIMNAFGLFMYWSSTTFWGFILAESLIALGLTLSSGAFQAWLVDRTRYFGYNGEHTKVFGQQQIVKTLAMVGGGVIGGYLAEVDIALPWLVASFVLAIHAILAMWLMREEYFVRKRVGTTYQSLFKIADAGWQTVRLSRYLRWLMLIWLFQLIGIKAVHQQWQLIFEPMVSTEALGYLFGIAAIAVAAGTLLITRTNLAVNSRVWLLGSLSIMGFGMIVTAMANGFIGAFVGFMLFEIATGPFVPVINNEINGQVKDNETRATVMSLASMSGHGGAAVGLMVSGAVGHLVSVSAAWVVGGVWLIGVAVWFGLMRGRR